MEPLVGDDEWVLRLIPPSQYNHEAQAQVRIQISNLQTKEITPPSRPSLFVESKTTIEDLEAIQSAWCGYGVCRFQAKDLRALGFDARWTPADCTIPEVREAHASICEPISKETRMKLIGLFNRTLIRPPRKL